MNSSRLTAHPEWYEIVQASAHKEGQGLPARIKYAIQTNTMNAESKLKAYSVVRPQERIQKKPKYIITTLSSTITHNIAIVLVRKEREDGK